MSSIQRDLSSDEVTVDGLDNLFKADTGHVMPVTSDDLSPPEITVDTTETWTLSETADQLNLSTRTVLRKLKTGALQGYKVIGSNGPEWRIYPVDTPDMTNNLVRTYTQIVTTDDQGSPDSTPDTSMDTTDISLVRELMTKLEALTYRNGYLEAQLAAQDEQIKLLTDSQHKPTWWYRVWKRIKGL